MNRNHFLTIFFFFNLVMPAAFSFDASQFQAANDAYRNGNFQAAYEGYEKLVSEKPAPELYYNMANAAFKSSKLGLAILNYERAQRLDPRNQDILENLKYAKSLVEYRVPDKRNWFYGKAVDLMEYVTTEEAWLIISLLYLLLIGSLVVILLIQKDFMMSTLSRYLLFLLIAISIPVGIKFYETKVHEKAVVTSSKVDARFGPSFNDKTAFSLVEGLEASVVDESNGWYRILLLNGDTGWVEKEGIVLI